jgi:hypothetical protein
MIRFSAVIDVDFVTDRSTALTVNGFWLAGKGGGYNKALWRVGEKIEVIYNPDDQFCYEVEKAN